MNNRIKLAIVSLLSSGLIACGSSNNNSNSTSTNSYTYEIQMVNLTQNQPLSPVVVIAHSSGYSAFNDGESASMGLETLAEAGDNTELISEAEAAVEYLAHTTTSGSVAAGSGSETLTLQIPSDSASDLRLTVVSMLVNTNDAFTGLDEADISNLALGDSVTFSGPTWDAGTELNTESAATIPGPAGQGTGFDTTRDDSIGRVRFHQGVVTQDDGLTTSALDESHRFQNPTSRITVTRTE